MKRLVQPEILDSIPPDDPSAVRSRQDLRRINGWMRNHLLMAARLREVLNASPPGQITELGAGDGDFMFRVAQQVSPNWPNVTVTLLDQQPCVNPAAIADFAALGWRLETVVADVFDWLMAPAVGEVVIANLFLHHFEDARLAELLRLISHRAKVFIALEPQRAPWPLFCSRHLWAIGCNHVTRHDATVSVRAGFSRQELAALWPERPSWRLTERRAGIFSHLFIAQKMG